MTRFERLKKLGLVRFQIKPDEYSTVEDLEGDMFNPRVNPDIAPEKLAEERNDFIDRINRDGIFGIIGEYKINSGWEVADSCWGFVGNDYEGSGYDDDIKTTTIDQLREAIRSRCRNCMGTGKARK